MRRELVVFAFALLLAVHALAALSGGASLEGKVKSFDEKKITLQTETGLVILPRSLYKKPVKSGDDIIVEMTLSDLELLDKKSNATPAPAKAK